MTTHAKSGTDTVEFLQIEPTTRCNFTCGFCAGRSMRQSDLPFESFAHALATFPSLRHVELQGEGESLLHPRFLDMVVAARARGIRVSFISNGSLLDASVVERLLDAGIEKISISIESADPIAFRNIRGGKLGKVIKNIESILETRNRRGLTKPVVGFSITVLHSTQDALSGIVDLYRRLGLDGGVTLQPLERKADYTRTYDARAAAEALSEREVEQVWIRFLANREIRHLQKSRPAVPGFFDELMEGWSPGLRSCPWLERGMYLGNEGHLTPCCMIKEVERHAYGRLGVDPLSEVLAARARLREQLGRGEIPVPCQGCDLAHYSVTPKWKLLSITLRGLWHRWFGTLRKPPAPPPEQHP